MVAARLKAAELLIRCQRLHAFEDGFAKVILGANHLLGFAYDFLGYLRWNDEDTVAIAQDVVARLYAGAADGYRYVHIQQTPAAHYVARGGIAGEGREPQFDDVIDIAHAAIHHDARTAAQFGCLGRE